MGPKPSCGVRGDKANNVCLQVGRWTETATSLSSAPSPASALVFYIRPHLDAPSFHPVGQEADVIKLAPPLGSTDCRPFPSSEPGFDQPRAQAALASWRAAARPPSLLPRAGRPPWETAAQKSDLHFGIPGRLPDLHAEPEFPQGERH